MYLPVGVARCGVFEPRGDRGRHASLKPGSGAQKRRNDEGSSSGGLFAGELSVWIVPGGAPGNQSEEGWESGAAPKWPANQALAWRATSSRAPGSSNRWVAPGMMESRLSQVITS